MAWMKLKTDLITFEGCMQKLVDVFSCINGTYSQNMTNFFFQLNKEIDVYNSAWHDHLMSADARLTYKSKFWKNRCETKCSERNLSI